MLEILNAGSYEEEKAALRVQINELQQQLARLEKPVDENVCWLFNSLAERKDVDPIVRFFCWYGLSCITESKYNDYSNSTKTKIWRDNEDLLALCGLNSFNLEYFDRHREYSILELISGSSRLLPIREITIRLEERYSYNGKYVYIRPFENFPISEEIEKKVREYLVGQLEMLGATDLIESRENWYDPFDFLLVLWINFHVLLSYNYWVSFYPRPSDLKRHYDNDKVNFEVGCKMPNEIKEMEGHVYLLDYMRAPSTQTESPYPNYWSCIDRVGKQVEDIFVPFIEANIDSFKNDW